MGARESPGPFSGARRWEGRRPAVGGGCAVRALLIGVLCLAISTCAVGGVRRAGALVLVVV